MKTIREKLNRKNKPFYRVIFSVVLLGFSAVIFLSSIFAWVYDANIFGWFVLNRNPYSSDLNFKVNSGYDVDISLKSDGGMEINYENAMLSLTFDGFFAGSQNSKTLTITHKNNEARDIKIAWHFGKPSSDQEIAYEYGNNYYYLGTQIAITDITMSISSLPGTLAPFQALGKGNFLANTSPLNQGQVTSVENEITSFSELPILKDVVLPKGNTTEIVLTFTFVDNGEDQSAYQSFDGACSRILFFELSEAGV